jgi:hypothetical protein
MKEDKSDILSKIGRESGFKVPENYFEDFASKMEQVIPQHQVIPEVKPTLWNRLRPYVYLAAMFASIWCMMWIFNDLAGVATQGQYNNDIVAGFQYEENINEFLMHGDISEYDIYTYKDSVAAEEANFME